MDDLDVHKLKTVPIDLEKLNDIVSKEVVKNTKFNKLNTKVNYLEIKIPDATNLDNIKQYKTDKQSLEKKTCDVENKRADVTGLVTTADLNTKIGEVENKTADHTKYITTPEFDKFADSIFDAK